MEYEPEMIPFNRPDLAGKELEYIADAIRRGHASGDGTYTQKCSALLEEILQVRKILLTTSCTDALEMSALLLGIRDGDEVIVPSFTFVSTVNAFVLRGARPVFVDIRPDTLNMDENQLEELISDRTKAIVPVHYGGVGCEMDPICEIAARRGPAIVEDNAHGLFARYKSRFLGTFGALATLSFHETKNFTCGEGGALIVNDPSYIDRAEVIREKGTNRSRFFRGQEDKYTWVDLGSSFLPSDILAAFLYAQLEARREIQEKRGRTWDFYFGALEGCAKNYGVQLPFIPANAEQSHHMFYILVPHPEERDEVITHLRSRGIHSVFHYLPLHLSAMGRRLDPRPDICRVTEMASSRLIRLPFFNAITEKEQWRVVDALQDFYRNRAKRSMKRPGSGA